MSSERATFEQIETERLVLEPIHEGLAPLMYDRLLDARLYAYIEERPPSSIELLEKRYKTWRLFWNENPNDIWLNWAARVRGTNEYAGWFQSTVRPAYALIAYMVFAPYQRRGYAREACRAIIDHVKTRFGTTVVRATIDPRNEASIALARSLGMTEVPTDTGELWFQLATKPA